MNATSKVRVTRSLLLTVAAIGLALGLFGAVIGIGLPGLIVSVLGWITLIAAVIWLLVILVQRSTATTRPGTWRPGDEGEAR